MNKKKEKHSAKNVPQEPTTQSIIDMPQQHAFLLLGEKTLFLCHQIMTHMEPHCYEFVMEVSIPDDIKEMLLKDRYENGNSHFFGNHEDFLFALPQIVSGSIKEFSANVWTKVPDSNPPKQLPQPPWGEEKPIAPWLSNVKVSIERIVHYRHLNRNESSRDFEAYVLFGRGDEAHILHSPLWQPEYDHVATLKSAPNWISQDQLVSTVLLSFPDFPHYNYSTICNCPFEDGSIQKVRYFGFTEFRDPMGDLMNTIPDLFIEIEKTWWFSTKIINYWNHQFCPSSKQIS